MGSIITTTRAANPLRLGCGLVSVMLFETLMIATGDNSTASVPWFRRCGQFLLSRQGR